MDTTFSYLSSMYAHCAYNIPFSFGCLMQLDATWKRKPTRQREKNKTFHICIDLTHTKKEPKGKWPTQNENDGSSWNHHFSTLWFEYKLVTFCVPISFILTMHADTKVPREKPNNFFFYSSDTREIGKETIESKTLSAMLIILNHLSYKFFIFSI